MAGNYSHKLKHLEDFYYFYQGPIFKRCLLTYFDIYRYKFDMIDLLVEGHMLCFCELHDTWPTCAHTNIVPVGRNERAQNW